MQHSSLTNVMMKELLQICVFLCDNKVAAVRHFLFNIIRMLTTCGVYVLLT